ncbi:butyrophilin subfamily 1 member A1 isoform X3 [Phascolarctos cinereus]|uniref:Butyrophilin subfamily 1 member A1 isoform X3 n=1 Tax=Phascolarctos cinereus TaxID=38626 RepID=A0A6P5IU05_PHACI|nr:butyrophilin subfamily 1 member A1 isoform X3 [Phascolarctos cinereus]
MRLLGFSPCLTCTSLLSAMMVAFPVSSQPRYLIFFFFLQLPTLDSAQFDVIGPVKPILVMVGEDVDLPCHLSPNISAESMEVRWYRNKISPAVYVYQKEKDQEGEQIKEYQGRTTFVRDNITEGNVAVTIHNVRASDDGQYRCFFKDDQMYEEAVIELKVASPFFSKLSPWMMSMAVILTALGLLTIGAIFFIWKLHRNKNKEKDNKSFNKEKLQEELRWKKAQLHAVDVTLDPDTAHPHLFLYEGLKSIRLEDTRQKLPDKPERFDSWPCVLGREGFTSGKHYWEVEVGDRTDWAIGACKENVMRKGFDPMTPENGFWAIELYGNGYWALTPLRTPLPLTGPPRRIAVFLEYESGHISFYDMTNGSHVYTFPQASFSGTLRPFFCLWSCGKKPLTICPIFNGPDEVTVIANAPVPSKESLVTPTSERSTPGDADIPQRSNSKLFPIQLNNGALDH